MYSVVMSSWGQAGRALGQPLPVGPTDAPRTDSTCGGGQLQPSPGSSTLKASVSDRQASGLENNLGSPTCQRRGWVSPSGSEASALAHPPGSLSRRTSGRRRDRPHAGVQAGPHPAFTGLLGALHRLRFLGILMLLPQCTSLFPPPRAPPVPA